MLSGTWYTTSAHAQLLWPYHFWRPSYTPALFLSAQSLLYFSLSLGHTWKYCTEEGQPRDKANGTFICAGKYAEIKNEQVKREKDAEKGEHRVSDLETSIVMCTFTFLN